MDAKGQPEDFTTEPATPQAWLAKPKAWLATPKAWSTEKNCEEGTEEIARRYLLQPVGGFPLWVGRDDEGCPKMSKDRSTLRG